MQFKEALTREPVADSRHEHQASCLWFTEHWRIKRFTRPMPKCVPFPTRQE
jgi:hypothetical protein